MNSLWKNSARLLSANVVAQAIGLVVYPILTRLYTPEDFGLLNLVMSIGGVLIILSTAEYHTAIVLPKEESRAIGLSHIVFLNILFIVGITCLSVPFRHQIAALFGVEELAHWWAILPIVVLANGLWNLMNYCLIRKEQYAKISTYLISQSSLNALCKVGLGKWPIVSGGLILSSVIAPVVALVGSMGLIGKKQLKAWSQRLGSEQLRQIGREYRQFPLFNLPRTFINMLVCSMPVFLLTPGFGLKYVGYFTLAITLSFTPINLIARSLNQVMFQHTAKLVQAHQPLHPFFKQYLIKISLVAALGLALVYAFIPWLVRVVCGENWESVPAIVRWLYPYLFMTFVCGPVSFVSDVFGKQKIALFMETAYLLAGIMALQTGIWVENFSLSVVLYSVTGAVYMLIQLIWYFHLIRQYEQAG